MLKGRKVMFFLPSLELGGSERFGLLLAKQFKKYHGADVVVWGAAFPGGVSRLCDESGIPWKIVDISWPRDILRRIISVAKFTIQLRRENPDIILAYTLTPSIFCGIVWRWAGAKFFIWNQRDILGYRMGRLFERLAVRNTPLFISNSDHGAVYLKKTFTVPEEKIRVLHNAVQLDKPQKDRIAWRSDLGAADRDFVAVMVANIHANKDHATLIQAWHNVVRQLKHESRSATLVLAGYPGETYDALRRLVEKLGISENVSFPGQVQDVSGLVNAADLCVFSSRSEGCPNGLLEAMAAGLAVVATDIPGIREGVGSEQYAWLAPVGNAEAMAEKILDLARSPEKREALGIANRHRIETVFNPKHICNQMVSLLEDSMESL